uniref:DnaJ homolog subfamily C member 7-like n=1 Tax=Tanacetum cinerariifolium TaxID=118510 RepID=A0A699GT96_TANCI|nr:DnaJ homolog subfamily C member 7-like [Tanacetum cinerariifolium]
MSINRNKMRASSIKEPSVLLSLIPSSKVFDAANIWNIHVCSDTGSRRVKLTSKKKSLCRFLKDLIDNVPSTLEDLMGRAKSYDMMNAKLIDVHFLQSDEGSRSSIDSLYESDHILEFDGAVKGNHGSAGAGVVLHDIDGSLRWSLMSRSFYHMGKFSMAFSMLEKYEQLEPSEIK